MKRVLAGAAVLAVLAVGAGWYWWRGSNSGPQYRTARVERGELIVTVSATGTIQPVTQVQVGTQVTGVIQKLFADFNSRVTTGQVVAQIDPAPFKARVDQDRANLARAEADVARVQANLVQAEKELTRARELARRELISPSELDAAVATHDSLVAQLQVARATVDQSKAALAVSEVNLSYTTIVSPIDGIVISRNVDVGQTVAASLQAPTLFVIAENLRRLQVQASVSEADVGRIAVGQRATFTVDAYRDATFEGSVGQVRLAPTTVQNVVTYTVIIDADNPDEKLLPGMTATVSFEVARREDVLKVPNAALRFMPPSETASGGGGPPRGSGGGEAARPVWVPGPGAPKTVSIVPGLSDGSFTEIVKGELKAGQEVIVGILQGDSNPGMSNPFAPSRRGGRR